MGRGRGVAVLLLSAHSKVCSSSHLKLKRFETKRNGTGGACMGSDICRGTLWFWLALRGGGEVEVEVADMGAEMGDVGVGRGYVLGSLYVWMDLCSAVCM